MPTPQPPQTTEKILPLPQPGDFLYHDPKHGAMAQVNRAIRTADTLRKYWTWTIGYTKQGINKAACEKIRKARRLQAKAAGGQFSSSDLDEAFRLANDATWEFSRDIAMTLTPSYSR